MAAISRPANWITAIRRGKVCLCTMLSVMLSVHPAYANQLNWIVPDGPVNAVVPKHIYIDKKPVYDDMLQNAITIFEQSNTSRFNLDSLLVAFDFEATAAVEYVRDQIRTEPYEGSLRDPYQVLAAGGGNSQDKSKLLVLLLENMGYEARIVRKAMDVKTAESIARSVCDFDTEYNDKLARSAGLGSKSLGRLLQRAQVDYSHLLAALPMKPGKISSSKTSREKSHYWVQLDSDGEWQNLVTAYHHQQNDLALQSYDEVAAGPENAHKVKFSLWVEELVNSKLVRRNVLDETVNAYQFANREINLFFSPAADSITTGSVSNQLARLTGGAIDIVGILNLDGETKVSKPVTINVNASNSEIFASEDEQKTALTGLYLTVSTIVDDEAVQTESRTILNLLPNDIRNNPDDSDRKLDINSIGKLTFSKALPFELQAIRQLAISNGGLDASLAAFNLLESVVALPQYLDNLENKKVDSSGVLSTAWAQLHALAVASEALVHARNSSQTNTCIHVDRPRIYLAGAIPTSESSANIWIDWLLDNIAPASNNSTDMHGLAQQRIWHGAIQSALETTFMLNLSSAQNPNVVSTSTALTPPLQAVKPDMLKSSYAWSDHADDYLLISGDNDNQKYTAWWRVNASSGATDARVGQIGNANLGIYNLGSTGSIVAGEGGVATVSAAEQAAMSPNGQQNAYRILNEAARTRRAQQARAAEAAAKRKARNEYLILVSAVAIGLTAAYAILSESNVNSIVKATYGER